MADLSAFVDESGEPRSESSYYLVTLVFHDQRSASKTIMMTDRISSPWHFNKRSITRLPAMP